MTEATAKFIKSHEKAEDAANQAAEVKMKKYTTTHNMTTYQYDRNNLPHCNKFCTIRGAWDATENDEE